MNSLGKYVQMQSKVKYMVDTELEDQTWVDDDPEEA